MQLKKTTTPSGAATRLYSNRGLARILIFAIALTLAGWAGARWQSWRYQAPDQSLVQADQTTQEHEQAALAGSMKSLTNKLGELQARVLAIEALRARVSEAAGLGHTAAELNSVLDTDVAPGLEATGNLPIAQDSPMDDIPPQILPPPSLGYAEQLGLNMDTLSLRLEAQEDAYTLVDAALAQQAGFQASLPTLSPVDYPALSSSFGWRRNPVNGRMVMHEGLDFVAPRGAPIYAASGGLVVRAGTVRGYGRMVEIDHGNGLFTRYAHASSLLVKVGDIVLQGQQIAKVGSTGRSTGDHLHFEVRMADYPMDPALFIQENYSTRLAQAGNDLALLQGAADAQATGLR